ncbi:MAG: GNAT family N-acetyltransferase [Synergistaceae bacterium]|jgi:N-acetylglutamate synthase-like GNAT family acetyltransferase|nr:GNAT family N-acetyltransferase [Synergistaceae bacterium]
MDPDDLVIRPARPDEADILSHIIFRAGTDWNYPRGLMDYCSEAGELSISSEEIEANPTYVVEDGEDGEILGFYSIKPTDDCGCAITNLCVLPEYVGTEMRAALFLHACELAETSGAEYLDVVSDPGAAQFYEEMGAERIGERVERSSIGRRALPVLRLNL